MIRIDRGNPSPKLRNALNTRLEMAVAARAAKQELVFDGYDDVKRIHYEKQRG